MKTDSRMEFVPEEFTRLHLLRLVEAVANINSEHFTKQVADTLLRINKPPIIVPPAQQM